VTSDKGSTSHVPIHGTQVCETIFISATSRSQSVLYAKPAHIRIRRSRRSERLNSYCRLGTPRRNGKPTIHTDTPQGLLAQKNEAENGAELTSRLSPIQQWARHTDVNLSNPLPPTTTGRKRPPTSRSLSMSLSRSRGNQAALNRRCPSAAIHRHQSRRRWYGETQGRRLLSGPGLDRNCSRGCTRVGFG